MFFSRFQQQEDLSTSRLNDSLKNLLELLHNQMNTEETASDTQTASTQTDFEEPVSKLDVSTETENTTITEEIEMKLEERVLLEVETQTDETTPPPSATTSGIASSGGLETTPFKNCAPPLRHDSFFSNTEFFFILIIIILLYSENAN